MIDKLLNYSVTNLKTGAVCYFKTLEQARIFCLLNEHLCLSIRSPIYKED